MRPRAHRLHLRASAAQVATYTSDIRGAGTDANVYIELHGDKGFIGKTNLDNAANSEAADLQFTGHFASWA